MPESGYNSGDLHGYYKIPSIWTAIVNLKFVKSKSKIIPENCDERCVNATIINRAYISSYLFCELWLDYEKQFKTLKPWEFEKHEEIISEHKQIRNALYNIGEKNIESELGKLALLRKKADYEPFIDISPNEVQDAITHMQNIFNHLRFQKN